MSPVQETQRLSPDAAGAADFAESIRDRNRALAADYMANLGIVRHEGGREARPLAAASKVMDLSVFTDPRVKSMMRPDLMDAL